MTHSMRAVIARRSGVNYAVQVTQTARPVPAAGQLLIKVTASGINPADLLQAQGRYPPPRGESDVLGLEIAGIVVEKGAAVHDFAVGDAVCALLAGGGHADYAVAHADCVLPIPPHVDATSAAALPEAHFTAWTNLMDCGRLRAGESVLIHGGAGGIGSAAIQLCAYRGHTVFATAGTPERASICSRLGATRAIDHSRDDFVGIIRKETKGAGVDMILDVVGADYIGRNMQAAAVGGRIVNIAFQAGSTATVNFAPMLTKHLSLFATTLRNRSVPEKRAIRDALARNVWPAIADGKIKPVVDRTFPLAEAVSALEYLARGRHIGKILLVP